MFSCFRTNQSQAYSNLKRKLEEEKYTQGIPFLREGESEEIIELKQQQQRKFLVEEYLDAVLKEEEAHFRSVGIDCDEMNAKADEIQPRSMEKKPFANCEYKSGKTRLCCQKTTESPVEMVKKSYVSTPILLPSTDTFSASPPTPKRRNKRNSAKYENMKASHKKTKGYKTLSKLQKHPKRKNKSLSPQFGSSLKKIAPNIGMKTVKGMTSLSSTLKKRSLQHTKEEGLSEFNLGSLPETNLHEKKWNTKALELIAYKKRFGHCDVPQLDPDFGQLGRWLRTQRIAYKGKREGRGEMPDQRIKLLEAIGVKWECKRGKGSK